MQGVQYHFNPSIFLQNNSWKKENTTDRNNPENNNKRPIDHIAHIKSKNTYDYQNIGLEEKTHYFLYEKWMFFILTQSFTQWWFVPNLVEIGPEVLENFILGWALHLNKVESSSSKEALCQVWLKLAFWRRRFFKFVKVFSIFCNCLPLKKMGPFIWTTWALIIQECFVPNLVEIGSLVLEKKIF